jgi:hypothetical protein
MLKPVENLLQDTNKTNLLTNFIQAVLLSSSTPNGITPAKSKILNPYYLNIEDVNVVMVNTQPCIHPIDSSGFLFGRKQSQITVWDNKFNNYISSLSLYKDDITYGKTFDYTFQNLFDQNVLMINVIMCAKPYLDYTHSDILTKNEFSAGYVSRIALMDELFYYLNYVDKPLQFIFMEDNDIINHYKKQINRQNVFTMSNLQKGPDTNNVFYNVNSNLKALGLTEINFTND